MQDGRFDGRRTDARRAVVLRDGTRSGGVPAVTEQPGAVIPVPGVSGRSRPGVDERA